MTMIFSRAPPVVIATAIGIVLFALLVTIMDIAMNATVHYISNLMGDGPISDAGFWGFIALIGLSLAFIFAISAYVFATLLGLLRRHVMRQIGQHYDSIERTTAATSLPLQDLPLLALPYEYRPLPSARHIRILELEPGLLDEPISVKLKEKPLDECADGFEALSYRWGDGNRVIFCEGLTLGGVTDNLWAALKQLRRESEVRNLWVDAICINQKDKTETGLQVPLMGEIYSVCRSCVVWLGWTEEETSSAFRLLEQMRRPVYENKVSKVALPAAGPRSSRSVWKKVNDFLDTGYRRYQTTLLEPGAALPFFHHTTTNQWAALGHLLTNPWYERVWTLQEIVLPADAYFVQGRYEFPASDFYMIMDYINSSVFQVYLPKSGMGYSQCLKVSALRKEQHRSDGQGATSRDLLHTLRNVRERDATQPQDKVVGALGLCRGISLDVLGIKTDDTAYVAYTNIASYLVQQPGKSLRLLSAVTSPRPSADTVTRTLPSWIPDWQDRTPLSRPMEEFEARANFCAGGPDSPFVNLYSSGPESLPHILHVKGKILDRLKQCYHHTSPEMIDHYNSTFPDPGSARLKWRNENNYNLRAWLFDSVNSYMGSYFLWNGTGLKPFPPPWQHYLASCIVALSKHIPDTQPESSKNWLLWRALTCDRADSTLSQTDYDETIWSIMQHHELAPGPRVALFDDLKNWINERKFHVSADGNASWVPYAAERGDLLCILQGCDLPIVLREAAGDHRFTVVGSCYVDGYMRGEAMGMHDLPLQDILLI